MTAEPTTFTPPAQPAALPPAEFDPREIQRILMRRKWLIVGTMLLITAMSAFGSSLLTPRYTAEGAIVVESRSAQVVNMQAVLPDLAADPATMETQANLIRTRSFAEDVLERLPPEGRRPPVPPASPVQLYAAPLVETAISLIGDYIPDAWLAYVGTAQASVLSPRLRAPGVLDQVEAVDALLDGLRVEVAGRLIMVRFTSTDAGYAALVANTFADLYVDHLLRSKQQATDDAAHWLAARVGALRTEVVKAERAIAAFSSESDPLELSGTEGAARAIAELSGQRAVLDAERTTLSERLRRLRELQRQDVRSPELLRLVTSGALATLVQQQIQTDRELAQLGEQYGPLHPLVRNLMAERESVTASIAAEVESALREYESQIAMLNARDQLLVRQLADVTERAAAGKQANVQRRELEREAEANRLLYTQYLNRLKETNEQRELIQADARVVTTATAPAEPSFPRPKLILAAGFVSSTFLGVLLALLMEQLDGRLRSTRQVERALGIRSLAMVPMLSQRAARSGRLPRYLRERPLSLYSEALRSLELTIQQASPSSRTRVVLVTSTLPGEGKTTLAFSFAANVALAGRKVALLELDLRRPGLRRQFDQPPAQGIGEYLAADTSLAIEDVAEPHADMPSLHVLRVKQPASNPSELLRSARLEQLLLSLKLRYEWVVIDAPPLLGLTDTRLLTRLADHTVFAVRWGWTTGEVARNGLQVLHDTRAPVLGAVVTQVDIARHAKLLYGDGEQYYSQYSKYYAR